jgi:2-methylisocitrate lyase-like PEP mutase family enzyme
MTSPDVCPTETAGLSIEDSTGDEADPLFSFELAVERVRAARAAIDEPGKGVVLTGRSETLARVAWLSFRQAAQEIPDAGTFTHFNDLPNPDALFEQR